MLVSSQPTYEGLKLALDKPTFDKAYKGSQPTYEGLKLLVAWTLYDRFVRVPSLPMRD